LRDLFQICLDWRRFTQRAQREEVHATGATKKNATGATKKIATYVQERGGLSFEVRKRECLASGIIASGNYFFIMIRRNDL
jgi:hypothetical protein